MRCIAPRNSAAIVWRYCRTVPKRLPSRCSSKLFLTVRLPGKMVGRGLALLPVLPHRLPLLHKRAQALLCVLGLHQLAEIDLLHGADAVGHTSVQTLVHCAHAASSQPPANAIPSTSATPVAFP